VLVLKLVRGGSGGVAVYVRSVEIDIFRVGVDVDGLWVARGPAVSDKAREGAKGRERERSSRARSQKLE
jgi:hypothetical protein